MKRLIALFALVAVALSAEAQENFKFGKVKAADLEKKSYSVDIANADAVILDELQQTYIYLFDSRIDLQKQGVLLSSQTTISRKVKILRDEGVRHATISFDYYCEKASTPTHTIAYVGDIEASSYSLVDGKVEKYTIKEEEINVRWVDDTTVRVEFTIPNVAAGSIIEYSYKMAKRSIQPYSLGFVMQHDIPVVSSRCEVIARTQLPPQMQCRDNWFAVMASANTNIKSSKMESKARVYFITNVPVSLRKVIKGGYDKINNVYDMCTLYTYSANNLPAVTAATPASDVATINVILQDNKL
ncbi:MAG: DUF3857 domain-containing protein [Alistipes sp.]|nr:DUF3857 domain-containing protein [Alistipes sp.]